MNKSWHYKLIASAGILLCAGAAALASDFSENGPGRLTEIAADSDFIVVASCVNNQPADLPMHDLQFTVRRAIKGTLKSFALSLNQKDSPSYNALTGSKPALVFLKNGPDGQPGLTTPFSAIQLEANEAALPGVLARELEIRSMGNAAKRDAALKQLILPLLAHDGNSYTGESLAEDLLDLCQAGSLHLSAPELAMISRVATNTDYRNVALPLALVLAQQDAPQTDAACLHVLMDTDALDKNASLRLAPVLAARPALRESFVQKIEQSKDSDRIGLMMTQLYLVDTGKMDAVYERLWHNNPATHREIEHALNQSVTPGRAELLRHLKAEPGAP